MKKLLSLFAAFIIVATFTGCSDEQEDTSVFQKNFVDSCVIGAGVTDKSLIPQIEKICG